MKTFNDKTAVITGAAGGIGSALAHALAKRGCHLALCDVREKELKKLAKSLKKFNVKVTPHSLDVTKKIEFSKVSKDIIAAHKKVNLLINNAGITLQKSFDNHSMKDLERILKINLWGVIYGCHYFKNALEKNPQGHVVNLSSMASFAGFPNQSTYGLTKKAVQGLSETLWAEWSVKGVGVTCVHPGAIRTDIMLATMKDADNIDAAKRNNERVMKYAVPPETAAELIIDAVRKNKKKLVIGKDAKMLEFLAWLMPSLVNWLMKKIAQKNHQDMETFLTKNT